MPGTAQGTPDEICSLPYSRARPSAMVSMCRGRAGSRELRISRCKFAGSDRMKDSRGRGAHSSQATAAGSLARRLRGHFEPGEMRGTGWRGALLSAAAGDRPPTRRLLPGGRVKDPAGTALSQHGKHRM
eukprot:755722-Hanusia_phi.AAC.2